MGADMLIACVILKKDAAPDKDAMLKALHKCKLEDLDEFWERCTGNSIKDELEDVERTQSSDLEEEEKKTEIFSKAEYYIKEVCDALGWRDVATISHKGDYIYVAGGMSYGDEPEGAYTTFDRFTCLPLKVTKAGGFK
jgi:hypothetical protein